MASTIPNTTTSQSRNILDSLQNITPEQLARALESEFETIVQDDRWQKMLAYTNKIRQEHKQYLIAERNRNHDAFEKAKDMVFAKADKESKNEYKQLFIESLTEYEKAYTESMTADLQNQGWCIVHIDFDKIVVDSNKEVSGTKVFIEYEGERYEPLQAVLGENRKGIRILATREHTVDVITTYTDNTQEKISSVVKKLKGKITPDEQERAMGITHVYAFVTNDINKEIDRKRDEKKNKSNQKNTSVVNRDFKVEFHSAELTPNHLVLKAEVKK